jgi:CRISPR-associated protein Cmr4
MDARKQILYIYTETPTHVGTGVGLSAVDLPIQREKHTGYPLVQASGIKGALRDTAENALRQTDDGEALIRSIFGGASGDPNEDFAGAMSPSDARILLFSVRALKGVFVWITSPTVLQRFKQETDAPKAPQVPDEAAQVSDVGLLVNGNALMLEEFTYDAQQTNAAKAWADYFAQHALHPDTDDYWQRRLQTHLVILPDDEFRDFVRYSTEITTRIHIDDVKKTVKQGQLFTQELLPADCLLYSVVHVTGSRDEKLGAKTVVEALRDAIGDRIQIGGDETVGRGRVRLNWQATPQQEAANGQ